MSPFDGAVARPDNRRVAGKKKPLRLGQTADQVYALAWRIIQYQKFFDDEQDRWRRWLAKEPSHEYAGFWKRELAQLLRFRTVFESILVRNPAQAIEEFELARRSHLTGAGLKLNRATPVRWALVGRAVEHVYVWLRVQTGKDRHPKDPRAIAMPLPVSALGFVATKQRVESEDDLKKLAQLPAVRRAGRGIIKGGNDDYGGQKNAAIALVAAATGMSEPNVKRAAKDYLVSRDQLDPEE